MTNLPLADYFDFASLSENGESALLPLGPSTHRQSIKRGKATMSVEAATGARHAPVIVVGNEKGGSGKSTITMHVAIALMKAGHRVATIDLDTRQKSFTNYIENRRAWAQRRNRDLATPDHLCMHDDASAATPGNESAASETLRNAVGKLAETHDFVVIDTPGHDCELMRLAHTLADTLITPLNDSFVDFDVLGNVDPETFGITGASHYAKIVQEARQQRFLDGHGAIDWIVLRNRLSMLGSRNKKLVGESLQALSQELDFRCVEGLAERLIFREFFLRGLTAVDDIDEGTLGSRPTMSHVTARQEVENLLSAMKLGNPAARDEPAGANRDAA
jgi:chromosome partitioning protein